MEAMFYVRKVNKPQTKKQTPKRNYVFVLSKRKVSFSQSFSNFILLKYNQETKKQTPKRNYVSIHAILFSQRERFHFRNHFLISFC